MNESPKGAPPSAPIIGLPLSAALPPRKKPNRRRHHLDHFRTDPEEHAELAARARAAGLSIDAFCRLKTLGDAGPRSRRSRPDETSRLKAQHLAALNRVGNNLNQATRALNEIALAGQEGAGRDRLAEELRTLMELFKTAIPALNETLAAICKAVAYDWQG